MSNSLADFADDDVKGREPVVVKIMALREQWKDIRYELQTGQVRRPAKEEKPKEATKGLQVAEIKVELQKTQVNLSKTERKLEEKPEHKLASTWAAEIARLQAIKQQYKDELRILSYETTQTGQ